MRLGVFCGSFNPVHKGHIKIVNYLINNNYLDKILIVPTLNYWDKQDLIDITHRINMLKNYENDKILIDKTHNHLIYTYELLEELKKIYKKDELFLIIGADNIINFDKWKNYKKILNYPIIIMNRNNINLDLYKNKYLNNKFIIINDFPFIDISSSEIRDNLNNKYLDKKVLDYIKKNNLYRGYNGKKNK